MYRCLRGTTLISGVGLLAANSGWTVTHTGDFNGDGKSDILYRNTDGTIALWLMNGTTLISGAGLTGAGRDAPFTMSAFVVMSSSRPSDITAERPADQGPRRTKNVFVLTTCALRVPETGGRE